MLFTIAQASLLDLFKQVRDHEEGQSITEYVFLVVGVAAVVGGIVAALMTILQGKLTALINAM
jgi:Flp pilus assembly pilin Flp